MSHAPSRPGLRAQLVGAWRLVSCQSRRSDGAITYPLSDRAAGLLVYTETGWMSGQLMRPDRPAFAAATIGRGSDAELRAAASGYVAYAGTFEVNEPAGQVAHHVQLSLLPNLIGTVQVRYAILDGDRLELSTPEERIARGTRALHLLWERIRSSDRDPVSAIGR